MIYNYTRCESVIAKILTDLDSTEARLRASDIKEWIFEAVDKIGAPMQYVKKESGMDGVPVLKIEDSQVPIPDDLQHLDGVAYSVNKNGPWSPMRTSTAIFNKQMRDNLDGRNIPGVLDHGVNFPMKYKAITSLSQLYTGIPAHLNKREEEPLYFIKPGWIVTNKKSGYIKLAYKAILTDERGYPLIPDLSSYQEAIYWYVTMKLSFSKWMKGTLGGRGVNSGQNLYFFIQQLWNFYRKQAYAEAMMPTADDMLNIKNDWNKLIPDMDGDDTFFKHIGDDQQFYSDYYYGY